METAVFSRAKDLERQIMGGIGVCWGKMTPYRKNIKSGK